MIMTNSNTCPYDDKSCNKAMISISKCDDCIRKHQPDAKMIASHTLNGSVIVMEDDGEY